MSRLGLTYDDIRKKLNPGDEPYGFLGAQDEKNDPDDVTESILEEEETALGRLNGHHLELTRYVSGEWLTKGARGDGTETSFTLGLFPASDVRLYKNYRGHWGDRRMCDTLTPETDYTINLTTGVITLTEALEEEDTLIAEYRHTALSKCKLLRGIVKNLVAVEWARRIYPSDESFARYAEWEKQAYSNLARLKKKDGEKLGIPMFDDLDLVEETLVARSVSDAFDADGGML